MAQPKRRRWLRRILIFAGLAIAAFYAFCGLAMLSLRWINPPTTAVQIQRRMEARVDRHPYRKRQMFVLLREISPHLQHAVVAAEDARFRQHHGFDWVEVHKVIERDVERGKLGRGGSTIDQQLVKNLFLTTERSIVRKAVEATLVPPMELFLSKNRILELYLNVIEWGPGVYGAEAASQYYYRVPASRIDREQAARLAAIIPAPLKRKPDRMDEYSAEILARMTEMGW